MLVPLNKRGGGRGSPPMEARHYRNLFLGAAAYLPIDAAAAAFALGDLPCMSAGAFIRKGTTEAVPWRPEALRLSDMVGLTLGQVLDGMIEACADPQVRASVLEAGGPGWTLTLCADEQPFATIAQRVLNHVELATFGEQDADLTGRRLVMLPLRAIILAGELLDTRETAAEELAVSTTAPGDPKGPGPGNESAEATRQGDLGDFVIPIRNRPRDRTRTTGALSKPESTVRVRVSSRRINSPSGHPA